MSCSTRWSNLTDSTQQRIIRTNQSELTGNWVNHAGVSTTQHLGEALDHLPGLVGFIFGSSKVFANCLAIFPDKLSARSTVTFDNEMGVTTGLASPSFPYFAVEPLVFLRHVEVPEGIPLAIEVGGS